MATGPKSGTSSRSAASYWGGRPVQDQMYSTAYLSSADWNDTRSTTQNFDAICWRKAELDGKAQRHVFRDGPDGARRRRS